MSRLRIATRKSPLARWQANHVAGLFRARFPDSDVSLVEMTTAGDRLAEGTLQLSGGKGLFVKELEKALLEDKADLAVHSLKDVTSSFPPACFWPPCPSGRTPGTRGFRRVV